MTIKSYVFVPGDSNKHDIAWVDMRDSVAFGCSYVQTVGTGDVQTFEILANAEADGGGTDVVIKAHALTPPASAVGDQMFLQCTAAEIAQEASDAGIAGVRYVSVSLELTTTTDTGVVTYIQSMPRFAHLGLTADIIA